MGKQNNMMLKALTFLTAIISVSQALNCLKCQGEQECLGRGGAPGSSEGDVEFCSGSNLCKLSIVNNKPTMRGCSPAPVDLDDYATVRGDEDKKCRDLRGGQQKDCYCSSDKCNKDQYAAGSASLKTTSAGVLAVVMALVMARF